MRKALIYIAGGVALFFSIFHLSIWEQFSWSQELLKEGKPKHHTTEGFRNYPIVPASPALGISFYLRRIWSAFNLPYVPENHYLPEEKAINQFHELEGTNTLTWIGQSTLLIRLDGKVIITDQLNNELSKIPPQTIYMGWHTDSYQPCEAEYRQTRQVLELLLEKGFSASILTKSDLILRDIDVLDKMDNASVSVSVAFNNNHIRQQFESNTIDTEDRITALRKLRKAGIKTSALICPVIPYITDVKPLIDMLAPYTDVIWIYGLSIQERSDQNWQNVQSILNRYFPNLKEQIEAAIFSKDHPYWIQLRQNLLEIQNDRQLNLSIHL